MSEEETPQERLARLRAKSPHQFNKPKSLHGALLDASLADYERLRSVLEWAHRNRETDTGACAFCGCYGFTGQAHAPNCLSIALDYLREQLPPARPKQLPPL